MCVHHWCGYNTLHSNLWFGSACTCVFVVGEGSPRSSMVYTPWLLWLYRCWYRKSLWLERTTIQCRSHAKRFCWTKILPSPATFPVSQWNKFCQWVKVTTISSIQPFVQDKTENFTKINGSRYFLLAKIFYGTQMYTKCTQFSFPYLISALQAFSTGFSLM